MQENFETYLAHWEHIFDKACTLKYSNMLWDSEDYLNHVGYRLWNTLNTAKRKGITASQFIAADSMIAVVVLFDDEVEENAFWSEITALNVGRILQMQVKTNRSSTSYWKMTFIPESLYEVFRGSSSGAAYYMPSGYTVEECYKETLNMNFEASKVWVSQSVKDLSGGGVILSREGENIANRWKECIKLQKTDEQRS